MSVSEKVAEYIKSHPQWKGKPLDKVILAMYSKGELSSEEVKRVLGSNIFSDDISETEAQEALNTTLFYGNSNTDAIGDNIVLHGQSSLEQEETTENTSAHLQTPAAAETAQTTVQSTAGTKAKAAGGAKTTAETISEGTSASENSSSEEKTLSEIFTERMNTTSTSLQKAEESNGFIGKAWSGIKNFFGFGASSNKVREAQETESELISQLDGENASEAFKELTGVDYTDENIEKFKAKEIKLKSEEALDGYTEGQKMAADIVGDMVSGIASVMVYTMAIAAAPVTGGASIALGFALAGTTGALVKSGIKALDAGTTTSKRDYNSFGHDMLTGAFSGILAPLTGGMGGAVGKTVAAKMGTQVIKEVGKEVAKDTAKEIAKETAKSAVKTGSKSGVKQFFKTALTNPTGFTYKGSTFGKLSAYAAESAVDGTVGGGVDNAFRTAIDGGSADKVLNAGLQGAVGGFFLSPAMNLGFKGAGKAGKAGKWLLNRLGIKTKVKAETTSSKGAADAASGTNTAERTNKKGGTSKKGGTNETSGAKGAAETNTTSINETRGTTETSGAAAPKKGGTADNTAETPQVKPETEPKIKPDETAETAEAPKPAKSEDAAPAGRHETAETAKPSRTDDSAPAESHEPANDMETKVMHIIPTETTSMSFKLSDSEDLDMFVDKYADGSQKVILYVNRKLLKNRSTEPTNPDALGLPIAYGDITAKMPNGEKVYIDINYKMNGSKSFSVYIDDKLIPVANDNTSNIVMGAVETSRTNTFQPMHAFETSEISETPRTPKTKRAKQAQTNKTEIKPDETHAETPKTKQKTNETPKTHSDETPAAAKADEPEVPKKVDESVEAPKASKVKVDIETVKKELEERRSKDTFWYHLKNIEITEDNAELMHTLLTMKENPDGTGEYRFDGFYILILSELKPSTVDKFLNVTDKDGNFKLNAEDIFALASSYSDLNQSAVEAFLKNSELRGTDIVELSHKES